MSDKKPGKAGASAPAAPRRPFRDIKRRAETKQPCPVCGEVDWSLRSRGKRKGTQWRCETCHKHYRAKIKPAPKPTPPAQPLPVFPRWALMLADGETNYETRMIWQFLIKIQRPYWQRDPLFIMRMAKTVFEITGHRRLYDVVHAYGWELDCGGPLLESSRYPWLHLEPRPGWYDVTGKYIGPRHGDAPHQVDEQLKAGTQFMKDYRDTFEELGGKLGPT